MGLQLHCRVWGEGIPSLPILLLHGHPGNADCMEVFAEAVAGMHPCVAPDLRGYGRSQVRDPFEMSAHLEDLQELLDRLGWRECLLLGWSLGGILALELALRLPGRVKGLVLVASAACPRSNHPPTDFWDQLNTGIASLLNWLWPGWEWNIDTFGRRSLYRYLIQRHTPRTYRYLAQAALPAYLHTSPQARQALRAALRQGYNREGELHRLHLPVLILAAEQDCHITVASSLATAPLLPQCTCIVYPNVAHLFPWEIPEQVEQDLRRWLRAQDWAKGGSCKVPSEGGAAS
ncbi:alpha/beta hydrolase [Synechococcus sp. 65AY6Li]|uniref:alpha/beta fold hydrolase n=1 Tax=Synechococcus sp. 65AY6Li TaxID=1351840 RepID=UPI000C1832BC|nr:alpha/beta hydrolase [Synechococcus sp. 65AY6Li]PIK89890.1 alpha/beta hydrolase [Synechococcus sp. 65AY6Li]